MRFLRLNFCEKFDLFFLFFLFLFFFFQNVDASKLLGASCMKERDVSCGKRYTFIVEVCAAFGN